MRVRVCVDSRHCPVAPQAPAWRVPARARGDSPGRPGLCARDSLCPCQGGRMVRHNLASSAGVALHGANLTWVVVAAVIALLALAVAGFLVREVLSASQGSQKMQEISRAVQEGAAAYLKRQFRTLGIFVVLIFFVLLLLPASGDGVRWGRSVFFLVGAL